MIGQLETATRAFAAAQRSDIRCQRNSETGELRVSLRGDPTPTRADIVMLTGTCVQTMLSSLDYVTSKIVNDAKGTDTRIHFPIDVDDHQLKASGSYAKIAKFDPLLADFVLNEIKPTKAENFPLWALKRLANTDKHRNLLLVANWQGFEIDKIERTDGVEMRKARFMAPAGAQNEGYLSIPNVKEYSEPKATVQISLREPDIVRPDIFDRYEVVETLSNFLHVTTQTIDAVEDFLTDRG
jgi:hypothetical protein